MERRQGTEERLRVALSGRYTLDREIGRGGMAKVYLARDLKHDRPVAIKVLEEELSPETAPHRFHREIQVTAGLIHPHILPLLDSDTLDGLHYYVMPYVKGESLRQRLDREGRLSLEDAVGIACEIADALGHAHKHGLVHRDIKPGNILLEEGHVFLADFGIVLPSSSGDSSLTREGRVVGTPHYQSPEQWTGGARLDGRSDLYSLGCVFYEMLAGEPPFRGPSPEAVAGKHLHEPPPTVRLLRPSIPAEVDRVLSRTLAKEPSDRFKTAEAFAEALEASLETSPSKGRGSEVGGEGPWRGRIWAAAGVLATALILWFGKGIIPTEGGGGASRPDTTRFWVLAPTGEAGLASELDVVQRLSHALERWDEITVADPVFPDDATSGADPRTLPDASLAGLANTQGVGRLVRVTVGAAGPDYRVNAELLDAAAGGERLGSSSVLIPGTLSEADSLFTQLTEGLLFRDPLPGVEVPTPGTTSLASRHAFHEGSRRLGEGDLIGADSAFSEAVLLDPRHSAAHLMVALTRFWQGMPAAQWRASAEQAALASDGAPQNLILAGATLAHARGNLPEACRLWTTLTEEEPRNFGAWLGKAICLETDVRVVPDRGSPSGWSFRTSYWDALRAYQRAFGLFPAVLASYRRGSYSELRSIFMTTANARRSGTNQGTDNPVHFAAVPAWEGDSLALVPYPVDLAGLQLTVEARALETAVHRQRDLLYQVILGWRSAYPEDADANEALAISLALRGDSQALDVIRQARTLTDATAEDVRLGGVEAWMQLAFALPDDAAGILRARILADSVLSAEGAEAVLDPLFLAALAAMTGRAHQAAELVRLPGAGEELGVPPPLREAAPSLLVYAALGGPPDTLDALEASVQNGIAEKLAPEERRSAEWGWLARPATLAFYEHQMHAVQSMRGAGDWLLDLQAAFAEGDSASLWTGLEEVRRARRGLLPSSVTLDAVLPEAELLVLMGRVQDAAEALDPALRAIPQNVPLILTDPIWAASVVRAAALRATIALRLDDPETATLWHGAVKTLWSDADPFLKERMVKLDSLFE